MKTTSKHFATFKRECLGLQREWQLADWELRFEHASLGKDFYADCSVSLEDRSAVIRFCREWPLGGEAVNQEALRDLAKHEVLHVLLGPMGRRLNFRRVITQEEADEAEHGVLMRLMKLIP